MSMSSHAAEPWQSGPGVLASAWRYRWWVLLATVAAGVLGFVVSSLQPTTYEATARLFLTDPRQAAVFGTQQAVDPERYIPQQTERVTSGPVLERISQLLSADLSPEGVDRQLTVDGDIELDLIEITAASQDPEVAAELANTAARAYTEVAQETRLASAREAAAALDEAAGDLDDQIAAVQAEDLDEDAAADQLEVLIRQRVDLTSRAQQQLVEARVFGSGVDFLEAATAPRSPARPAPKRDAVLAAVLGAALAAALAYRRAGRMTTVERRTQPADILGAPLLGVLPIYRDSRGAGLDERLSLDAEAQESYEFLLSSIEYELAPLHATSLLITSAEPGQGKTEVALQLSVTALLQGRRTLLIDGDLRVRSVTHLMDADGGPGLVDLAVSSPRQYRSYVQTRPILGGEAELPVLPAGSTADEGAGSLRQPGVRRGLKVIAEELDLVIIDSAPLLATADTTTLSSGVDAMLLVVRAGTKISDLQSLRERLSFVGCPVLGYVFITGDASDVGYAFGYGSYRYRHARTVKSEVVGMPESRAQSHVAEWLREEPTVPSGPPARPPLARRPESPDAPERADVDDDAPAEPESGTEGTGPSVTG
ncbi:MAG: hypothetical protein KY461_13655 [Actinobacteria bacterium]|nr:hypothetical protein [Actinomycetota bacterium]